MWTQKSDHSFSLFGYLLCVIGKMLLCLFSTFPTVKGLFFHIFWTWDCSHIWLVLRSTSNWSSAFPKCRHQNRGWLCLSESPLGYFPLLQLWDSQLTLSLWYTIIPSIFLCRTAAYLGFLRSAVFINVILTCSTFHLSLLNCRSFHSDFLYPKFMKSLQAWYHLQVSMYFPFHHPDITENT